jgi:calcineurin-like phosphoesterase family protein
MDRELIKNWNSVIKYFDKVYYLGDFCLTHDSNAYGRAMRKLHGRKVFLRGNHDERLRHADYFIYLKIDGINIFMRHWPPWEHPLRFPHSFDIPVDVDLILCGHVHDKWKFHEHIVGQRRIPVINIGTDVWGYKPINLTTIMEGLVSSKRTKA